ncbi:RteC domain-containing protein [Pedobacter borealis]|uniref:RteC domain-containing protein n=1 Tax=Pedobacter borealis TaxID=475254 RepID=UPI0004939A1A|nr:RteC domain-containing protein [Pedobacter borealis]
MELFTTNLYSQMQEELQSIGRSAGDLLYVAEQSYLVACGHLRDLKTFTKEYNFKDEAEEIRFFKEIKPSFLKEVVYFMKVYDVESLKPVGGNDAQRKYYLDWIEQAQKYFERNRFIYLYHRMEKSHLDHKMFVREPEDIPMVPNYSVDSDPLFSNVFSYKMAKVKAMEDLIDFLQVHLRTLDDPENGQSLETGPLFTGSKAQFYELGYALQAAGVFNNGNATLKQVFDHLQYCFRIKAANYYGYFNQAIRIRKKNRTPFIDLLKEFVIRKMDESDEFPRFSG